VRPCITSMGTSFKALIFSQLSYSGERYLRFPEGMTAACSSNIALKVSML